MKFHITHILHFTKYGTDDREGCGTTVGGGNALICCNLLLTADKEEENGPIPDSQALTRKRPTRKQHSESIFDACICTSSTSYSNNTEIINPGVSIIR